MDEVAYDALTAVQGLVDNPQEFFAAVRDDCEEHRDDFDGFKTAFEARNLGAAAEELVRYLDNNGRQDTMAKLAAESTDTLVAEYDALESGADLPDEADEVEGEAARQEFISYLTEYSAYWDGTEENWNEFLGTVQEFALENFPGPAQKFFDRAADEDKIALFAEYGITIGGSEEAADEADDETARQEFTAYLTEYSAYWDGTEENWDEFLGTVQEYALENFLGPAQEFFDRAADEDKIALFAEYGITIEGAEESAAGTSDDAEGEALWVAAVEAYGSAWAEWDGTEEGWQQYRDWFYEATNTDSPETYAIAYEKLNPLNELGLVERIAALQDFGFTITAGAEAAAEEAVAQPTPEDIAQAAEVLAGASDALPEADQQLVTPDLLKETLEADPDLATLSPEDLAEVMREVGAIRTEMQAG